MKVKRSTKKEKADLADWVLVQEGVDDGTVTERLQVPGGWIYRSRHEFKEVMAMAFVPAVIDESR